MRIHPLADRLAEFREMAVEAKRHAAGATSAEMKLGYKQLLKSWDDLIGEIESTMMRSKRDAFQDSASVMEKGSDKG